MAAVLMLAAALLCLGAAGASAQGVRVLTERAAGLHAGEFVVPLNESEILQVDRPVAELLVGNPEIADVLALTDRTIYVLGRQIGSTNLTIYGPGKRLIAVLDLVVSYDVEGLKAKLFEIMPEEEIEVRTVNGAILLGGAVSTASRLAEALAIADRFAPGAVTNSMTVLGSQQVMLEVRFAEVSRSAAKQLGLSTSVLFDDGVSAFQILTNGALTAPFAEFAAEIAQGNFLIDVVLDALEEKGLVKTLAEPNLVALSGDTASFLAGGEFPIPVAQDEDTITIEFKEFGVGLAFTPTVIGDDLINLIVAPEVSALDQANAVTLLGTTIPALTTRRAKTTIELRDGQSFAIAGLLQSNYSNNIRQFPWLGDLPVLGPLFRSTQFQRNETELVIIVTPRLVAPAPSPMALAAPTDRFVPPSDLELFLLGRREGQGSGLAPAEGGQVMQTGGGIAGPYGHIIQ